MATTTENVARPLTWRFALLVVAASLITAAVVRLVIVVIASSYARQQISGLEILMIVAAFALVMGYIVAVGGVGLGMRNRSDGGKFTLVFALTFAAIHIIAGLTWGMGILTSFDNGEYALILLPAIYTVPAVILRLVRWWWVPVILAAGVAASTAIFAISASR